MSVTQLTLLTSLSMMGAGIIMLPAKFAEIGAISMLSWMSLPSPREQWRTFSLNAACCQKEWEDWAALQSMRLANPALFSLTILMQSRSSSATLPSLWLQ